MSDAVEQGETVSPPPLRPRQPLQHTLAWLLALACLYTLYFAKSLLLPVVVAALFALLLSPLVAVFKRFHVPRTFSALLLLAAIGGPFTLLGSQLAEPAQKWWERLPELSAQLSDELDAFGRKLTPSEAPAPQTVEPQQGFRLFGWLREEPAAPATAAPANGDPALSDRVMQGGMEVMVKALGATPAVLAQFFTFLVLVLFMLIFGPSLYSTFIQVFPQVRDKQAATDLLEQVQRELSRYILTVSLINTLLGAVTAGVLALMEVEDALLWGVMVGLLNFAPYVGPVIGMLVLCLAGIVQYGPGLEALLPALVFFCINLVEAQFVTPTVLGQRMRLHPLVLMLWLILWGWLWGVVGVLIAVPLLVCLKLAADRMHLLQHWVKLIESPL
ncbi:AI-2E family transporter [Halopseudomonas sp.]|uniref:AI-2E family transporter n=1 Tax=Halopseudomonas sp. TaxID=2901191 RepID=UPI00311FFB0D